jgi:dATP pyrophosphohydrolase
MSRRALFQVLVLPYAFSASGELRFAIFRRVDHEGGYWQGIAGGGRPGESPLEAARREAAEEAGIPSDAPFLPLDSITSVPVEHFAAAADWPADTYVIPEYSFGVEAKADAITISHEHAEHMWLSFEAASARVKFDSNRTALWELHQRLMRARQASPTT